MELCKQCHKREAIETWLFADALCADCADDIWLAAQTKNDAANKGDGQ